MRCMIPGNIWASGSKWIQFIGVGRFRILGGQGLEYWGGAKGGKITSTHMTS